MKDSDHAPGYVPNGEYGQADWDEVCDNPELTDEQIADLRPGSEVLPGPLYRKLTQRRPRGPQKAPTKALFSLRIDHEVLEAYRNSGQGWQGRMNEALRKAIGL